MSLKSRWRNLGIKKKVFLWSVLTITLSFTLLYLSIGIFMPRVYEKYKIKKIYTNLEMLKSELANDNSINIDDTLDDFAYDNNLDIVIFEKDNNNNVRKVIYSSFREGVKYSNKPPIFYPIKDNNLQIQNWGDKNLIMDLNPYLYLPKYKKGSINIEGKIYLKSLENTYNMIIHVANNPLDEATTIVTVFIPFALIAIIVIACSISLLYSMQISKPLIKINKVANKMANLDFDNVIKIKGNDEIGQLSTSLNTMNGNLKEAFLQLEKMNSKLKEEIQIERMLEKERREFIATISHELKSPITIVSGQLEGMIYNIGKYKDRDAYLKESYTVMQNMSDLVKELLYISEKENNNFQYEFEVINLTIMIKSIIKELNYFLEQKNIKLITNIEEEIFIEADEALIKKAITNIIKNSINHSPDNESIFINLDKYKLTVENTGVTIPEDEIEDIFNAFYRVDKSRNRKTGGSGLGLYIVKTILDKHKNIDYSIKNKNNSVLFTLQFK